jgi:DNA-binding transcriptional regulator YhcF (GntR family)
MLSKWTTLLIEATMNINDNILVQVKEKLEEFFPFKIMDFHLEPQIGPFRTDFITYVSFGKKRFKLVGEIIKYASFSHFRNILYQLRLYAENRQNLIPIVIAKYLSPKKREECKKAGINFLDFSGNVFFHYKEGIHIERVGFANKFPEFREMRGPFSDKASLILREMLKEDKIWGVRECAEKVNLDAGYVSRMFQNLEKLDYLEKINSKGKLKNKKVILEDWINFYNFRKNKEFKYFFLAKEPKEILERLKNLRIPKKIIYALGFHAGAYLIAPHAVFNEVHVYVADNDSLNFFEKNLKLRSVEQGANLIFLFPYYKHSVFYDRRKIENLWVVSDIQLYIDLYSYPLRGAEQAEHLYEKRIKKWIEENWVNHEK